MNDIVYMGKHSLTFNVPRHEHNSWELIYCTNEGGKLVFDDFELPYVKGDIVVIPPHTPHSNTSVRGFTNIHANLDDTTLNFKQPVLLRDDSYDSILNAFSGAYIQYYENADEREAILSAYGSLIAAYILSYQNTSSLSKVVQEIENCILRNYSDPNFAVDDYLHSLPYSYDYLRKLFQKELGMTPHKFLNDKRLQTAANMLCSEYNDGNISEISIQCGYREPLYFSRMFKKKYGVSPSSYYAMKRQTPDSVSEDSDSQKIMLDDPDE